MNLLLLFKIIQEKENWPLILITKNEILENKSTAIQNKIWQRIYSFKSEKKSWK